MEGGERWQSKERRGEQSRGEERGSCCAELPQDGSRGPQLASRSFFFSNLQKKKEKKKQLRSDSGADKTATRSTAETNAFNSFVTSGHLKKQT